MSGLQVHAQIAEDAVNREPIPAGKWLLYPFMKVDALDTDNLFYSSEGEETSTRITTFSPGLIAELPFSHSFARLGYAARFREYSTDALSDNTSHFLQAETNLVFGNGAYIRLYDDYQRGVLDTQSIYGDEIRFRGQRFEANSLEVELGHERPLYRKLAMIVRASGSDFPGEVAAQFYDVSDREVLVEGAHKVGRRAWVLWAVSTGRVDYDKPTGATFEASARRVDNNIAEGGLRLELSPRTYFEAKTGYVRSDFEGDVPSSFHGMVGEVNLTRSPRNSLELSARYRRQWYPSVYADNNYYVSDRLIVRVARPHQRKLSAGGMVTYAISDYPEPDPERQDDYLGLDAWIGFRQQSRMEWRLFGAFRELDSSQSDLDYQVRRIGIAFLFGY